MRTQPEDDILFERIDKASQPYQLRANVNTG